MNDLFVYLVRRRWLLASLLMAFIFGSTFAQTTRYVSTTGTNSVPQSATSWATSTTNLQGAIDASAVGDQVWVASGTYKPTGPPPFFRDYSFAMKNGVAIYGGFAGTETALSQRPAITITAPSGTTLSGDVGIAGNPTDNSFHLFNNPAGLDTTAYLDGFVIANGNTIGSSPETYGGGMYNKANGAGQVCSPKVVNCVFRNHTGTEGGAIYNNGNGGGVSSPVFVGCTFQDNTASSFGGAVLNDGGSGGMSSPVFVNCLFLRNSAPTGSGGALFSYGQNSGTSSPRFTNCSFQNNTAASGGALYNDGSSSGTSSPQLTNCSFQSNSANSGGVLYNNGVSGGTSSPQLTNCVLFGNGGTSTFGNNATTGPAIRYSFLESTTTGYTSLTGNLTATTTPFASTTSTQLANGSPPINAGDPTTTTATAGRQDLAGNPRFFANGRIDMGAYELQEALEIYSLHNGTWNDSGVWSVNRIPQPGERVRLKHQITIPAAYLATAGPLLFDPTSRLIYDSGGRLILN